MVIDNVSCRMSICDFVDLPDSCPAGGGGSGIDFISRLRSAFRNRRNALDLFVFGLLGNKLWRSLSRFPTWIVVVEPENKRRIMSF